MELGLVSDAELSKNAKVNKSSGIIVMLGIIYGYNGERTFFPTFLQSYIFINVFSLFDALVIDCLWVSHSKYWDIPGTEDLKWQYTDIRKHLQKQVVTTVVYTAVSAIVAGLVMLFD